MEYNTEIKFGDLQMDERYKKLERTLKLASLRKENRREDESCRLSTCPSISSINVDPFDSSTNLPFLQTSRIGSVVVSSSNNLMNVLLKKKDITSNNQRVATSSVKKFNEECDSQFSYSNDRAMMPPPNFDNVLRRYKNCNIVSTHNIPNSLKMSQKKFDSSDIDRESSIRKNDHKLLNNNGKCNTSFSSLQVGTLNVQNKKARIFRKWKVTLNEQCQLIIKGTVECGQVARSKPVIKRVTSTSVESVFKHTYLLQGNIIDDEYELPDYVKGKFFNGFPDDWENVYLIWKTFVQEGSMITFRWPTPLADSDDDLKSEITDITFAYLKSPPKKILQPNCSRDSDISVLDHECPYNVVQKKNTQSFGSSNIKKNDIPMKYRPSNNIERTFQGKDNFETSRDELSNGKENHKEQETICMNVSDNMNKISTLKDTLNGIVNNLTDKNCTQECITKIIEIFDCLNYVVSHGSVKDEESNTKGPNIKRDKCVIKREEKRANSTEDNDLLQRKRTFTEMNNTSTNTSESESEIYAGVPKISVERVLRQREQLMRPCKRKMRKRYKPLKHDCTVQLQCTSNLSVIPPRYVDRNYVNKIDSRKTCNVDSNDSIVRITENESNHPKVEKCIDYNIQDNLATHAQSDIVLRRQTRVERDDILKSKNLHEMREHFIEENLIDVSKPAVLKYNAYELNKHNERDSRPTRKANITMPISDFSTKTNIEKQNEDMDDLRQRNLFYQSSPEVSSNSKENKTKTPKPIIISSNPVKIDVMHAQSTHFVLDNHVLRGGKKVVADLNNEMETSLEESKFQKNLSITKKADSSSLVNTKNSCKNHVKVQLNNVDFLLKESSRNNLPISNDNQCVVQYKAKLLSAWTPQVLCGSELYLVFDGKLLNEAGHVERQKFRTDVVIRRLSQKLIETRNHEFYQLVGDLNNAKCVVPKKIVHQCRYGCPSRIEQFCKTWKSLQSAAPKSPMNMSAELNNTSMDTINIGVSSKGRRIIPLLSYWTGERIILKDNNPVYNPGTTQDSVMCSPYETSIDKKQVKNIRQQKEDTNKNSSSGKNIIASSPEKDKEVENGVMKAKKRKKATIKSKGRIINKNSSSSSDDRGISVHKNAYVDTDALVLRPRQLKAKNNNELTTSDSPKQISANCQLPPRKSRDVVCTYYRGIPVQDDVLSDDQVSHV